MTKEPEFKAIIDNNAREIKELRNHRHDHANRITLLKVQQQDVKEKITSIKNDIFIIRENHLSHIEKDMAGVKKQMENFEKVHSSDIIWIKEKFGKIGTQNWAIIILLISTLTGIIVKLLVS